jgi:glutamine synthetase
MCNVSEELATHPDLDPSNFYLRCPRSTLQKVVEYGKTEHQLFFLTGFEIEFYLLDPETIADRSKFNSPPYLFRNGACGLSNKYGRCAQDCVGRMQKSGIVVETLHTIGGRQQYQISTGPLPVLQSTDALVQAQEIIRLTALDHILRAVFLPKPFENSDSSAIHAHLSINTLKDHKLVLQQEKEFIEDSFMTGVLDRLPLITAIGMPTEVSYRRVNPLAVGKWVAWGTGNRDTPVRRIKHNRWEFRAMDVTANMYLTMATYIASGLLGIQNKRGLQIQDTTEPIEALSEDILRNRGITTPMPPSLKEAMVALKLPKYQEYLDTILGPQILNFYIKVKEQEIACLASYTDEERESLYFEFY